MNIQSIEESRTSAISKTEGLETYFSVVTPTHECEQFIHRVYDSLCLQSFTNFEWIIIDDGSSDDTSSLVGEFAMKSSFKIVLHQQTRAGKMSACNRGVEIASGKFIVFLDADDKLKPHALQTMYEEWECLTSHQQNELYGVVGHCEDQFGNAIGTQFPENRMISNIFDMMFTHKVKGEKLSSIRRSIIRRFPFREDIDFYVPEFHIWFPLSEKYNALHVNCVLRIFYINQSDRISLSNDGFSYVKGHRFHYLQCLNKYAHRLPLGYILKTLILYLRADRMLKETTKNTIADLESTNMKILAWLLVPVAYCYYLKSTTSR